MIGRANSPATRRALALALTLCAILLPALALAAPARPFACRDLIVNGGFEGGYIGWTAGSALHTELLAPFYPRTGKVGAWLGGANKADDSLTQTVALPADAAGLTLRAWWAIHSEEAPGARFDIATIDILRADGSIITTTLTIDNESAEAWVWNEAVADLTALAGQTAQLRLRAVTDATGASSFFFDDVSLLACAAGDIPTATPTPTATVSPPPGPRPGVYLPVTLR